MSPRPKPECPTRSTTFDLPVRQHERLHEHAVNEEVSVSALLREGATRVLVAREKTGDGTEGSAERAAFLPCLPKPWF